jgi:hypothetical protein
LSEEQQQLIDNPPCLLAKRFPGLIDSLVEEIKVLKDKADCLVLEDVKDRARLFSDEVDSVARWQKTLTTSAVEITVVDEDSMSKLTNDIVLIFLRYKRKMLQELRSSVRDRLVGRVSVRETCAVDRLDIISKEQALHRAQEGVSELLGLTTQEERQELDVQGGEGPDGGSPASGGGGGGPSAPAPLFSFRAAGGGNIEAAFTTFTPSPAPPSSTPSLSAFGSPASPKFGLGSSTPSSSPTFTFAKPDSATPGTTASPFSFPTPRDMMGEKSGGKALVESALAKSLSTPVSGTTTAACLAQASKTVSKSRRPWQTQGINPTEGDFERNMTGAGATPSTNSTSSAPSSTAKPAASSVTAASARARKTQGIKPTEGEFVSKTAAAGVKAGSAASLTAPLLGRRVLLNGLVGKPELNGRTGTTVSFNDDKKRYSVELDPYLQHHSSLVMIKPCNLLPHDEVMMAQYAQQLEEASHIALSDEDDTDEDDTDL